LKGDAPPEAEWRKLTKEQRDEYLKGLNQFIVDYFNNCNSLNLENINFKEKYKLTRSL
jgi:hypothetical protein